MSTIWIRRLRVIGEDQPKAEIEFGPNLSVISGASDTGKSYILDCIRYMLASGSAPEVVPESAGYSSILLEIVTSEDKQFVLQRSLKLGGDFLLFAQSLDDWTGEGGTPLKAAHSSKKLDNVSRFLLNTYGIGDVIIKEKKTKKRSIRIRDVSNFNIIDEIAIIHKGSPLHPSRQYKDEPVDESVFEYLTSGQDASNLILAPEIKVQKASWKASHQLYTQLIDELKNEVPESEGIARSDLLRIDQEIEKVTTVVAQSNDEISRMQSLRNDHWRAWHTANSRRSVVGELVNRFELLGKHYTSDIERLSFLSEADHYLSQIGTDSHCPVCGRLLEDHSKDDHDEDEINVEIRTAATVESAKLRGLLDDLGGTQGSLKEEAESLDLEISSRKILIDALESRITQDLMPRMRFAKASLQELYSQRSKRFAEISTHARIKDLVGRQQALGDEPKEKRERKDKAVVASEPASRREFLNRLQDILIAWRYLPVDIAEINPQNLDLIVAGQNRSGHGKGFRAILQSAFTIALMLQAKGRHPAFVVLDSPLTSFRENDEYEAHEDVQSGFFEYLMKFEDGQVIVLENKEPPAKLKPLMHYEHFTGVAGLGRKGFYPE